MMQRAASMETIQTEVWSCLTAIQNTEINGTEVLMDVNSDIMQHTEEDEISRDENDLLEGFFMEREVSECVDIAINPGEEISYTDKTWIFKSRRILDQLDSFYQQKQLSVLKAREELKVFHRNAAELKEVRDKIEENIEREKDVENSVAVLQLQGQHKRVCAELQVEEDLGSHLAMILKEHELELCQVELELGRFLDLRQEVELEEKNLQSHEKKKQKLRVQRERNALRAQHTKFEHNMTVQEQEQTQKTEEQEQTLASRHRAAVYLKQTLERMKQTEAEKEERRNELINKRLEAVMALKASIAATQETLRAARERHKISVQTESEKDKQIRKSMKAKGLNSTELIHRRRLQEQLHKTNAEMAEKQRARRIEIVSELLLEKDKSPSLIHEKSSDLKKHDERFLQNILPSSHMWKEIPEREITSRVRPSTDYRSDVRSSPDPADETWGRREEVEDGEERSLAQPEFTGYWEHKHRDYMATSDKDIHLQTSPYITTKTDKDKSLISKTANKTVKGGELRSPSFISKPEVLQFKDFDVGRTYKKKVILTNVTYITNYCKLLGVSQNLIEYVSVSFEPPGPMSAGMACELEAIFRPLLDVDLDGVIQFVSATGPFSLPIKCSKKKCEVIVDRCLVNFGSHVVGQTITQAITMTNRGALGTHYTLTPISTTISQHTNKTTGSSLLVSSSTGSIELLGLNRGVQNAAGIPAAKESTEQVTSIDLSPGPTPIICHSSDETDQGSVVTKEEQSTSEQPELNIVAAHEGEIGPHMNIKIPIIFTPTVPGEAKLEFKIMFSQLGCEPVVVSVSGMAESPPVWVSNPNVDLKICMYEQLYQDSIEFQNRSSTALKLTFWVCEEMRNHMCIVPKTGIIQAKSSFSAQLKFIPRLSLYADAKTFFNPDTGVLEVPLTVQVADQVAPIAFTVHAVVTSSDLQFGCCEVDFGHCTLFESVQTTVRLTNCSLLPQEFGFVDVPKFIDVQPNDGFGSLLPLQSMDIHLTLSASKAGEFNFQLTCKTSINRDFLLSCRATAVHPSLKLSDCLVEFGGTAVGDRSTAILYVENSNTTQKEAAARLFAFSVPENSEITLNPTSGHVLPGQRCLVQVTFSPSLSDNLIQAEALRLKCHNEELKKASETACSKHAEPERNEMETLILDKEQDRKMTLTNDSPFPSSDTANIQKGSSEYLAAKNSLLCSFNECYGHHVIPCFISTSDPDQDTSVEPSPHNTLYLELRCPAVRPTLLLISDHTHNTIDFNRVPIGQKVLKKVVIQNISSDSLKLMSSLLDLTGPFSVLNALRTVGTGETHTLIIAFNPTLTKKYREVLQVSCSQMTLELTLCGEAVNPVITCSNEEGILNFEFVPENESATRVFRLHNLSCLDVQFKVLLDSHCLTTWSDRIPAVTEQIQMGVQNYSGLSVFCVSPSGGTITPASALDITVTFRPDHESLHYRDVLRVQLMNKQTVCVLELRGSSCKHNMFVSGGDPLDVCSESLVPSHIYTSGDAKHKDRKSLLLTLKSVYQESKTITATKTLEVGYVSSSKPTTNRIIEFIWENISPAEQRGFSVNPMRGTVDLEHRRTITITWTPPSGLAPNEVIQACGFLTLRGDETEVYNVTLVAYTEKNTPTYNIISNV